MSNWFAWLDYGFMKNALIAILIITPLFGVSTDTYRTVFVQPVP